MQSNVQPRAGFAPLYMPDVRRDYATRLISSAERSLGHRLTSGECVDLLVDNTGWSIDYARRIVAAIR